MTASDHEFPRRALVTGGVAAAAGVGLAACSPSAGRSAAAHASQSTPSSATPTASPSSSASPVVPPILTTAGPDIQAGPRASKGVALTFHGAGDPHIAMRLLDILHAHDARVTVFAVGNWAVANRPILERILRDGHDLGNHTWSHLPMRSLTASQADIEIARGAKVVAAVRGSAGPLFRPSGTPTSDATIRAAAAKSGYQRCISYDVDTLDYTDPGVDAIVSAVRNSAHGGSIVSLHFGHEHTVEALPDVLTVLQDKGLHPMTVTALLAEPGDPVVVRS